MKNDDINWVRKTYKLPDTIPDERISEVFKILGTGGFHITLRERVGNELVKEMLLHEVVSRFFMTSVFLENQQEIRLQRTCEDLFVDGYYDACCVMSRSCAEYLLQDLCLELLSPDGMKEERETISKIINLGKNPWAKEMMNVLGDRLTAEDKADLDVIFNNGDWVVHHRYDEMTGRKMAEKYEQKMPLFRINKATGMLEVVPDHEKATLEWYRPMEERRMAHESLRSLYRLIYKRRGMDSEEAKKLLTNYAESSSRSDSPPS